MKITKNELRKMIREALIPDDPRPDMRGMKRLRRQVTWEVAYPISTQQNVKNCKRDLDLALELGLEVYLGEKHPRDRYGPAIQTCYVTGPYEDVRQFDDMSHAAVGSIQTGNPDFLTNVMGIKLTPYKGRI